MELKRGTNRAAFASPDPSPDRFSGAEALLFGQPQTIEGEHPRSTPDKVDVSAGRILRSLVEPPEPVRDDDPAPARRGRKPGSKNRPKDGQAAAPLAREVPAERPRRGRRPGSKNKPKLPVATAFPAPAEERGGMAEAMRAYGFSDDGVPLRAASLPAEAGPAHGAASPPVADPEEAAAARRPRLRDRSPILRRYVLDLEPGPGQPGALRARRRARAGR